MHTYDSAPSPSTQLNWLDILWRVLVTLLILFALGGPGAGFFNTVNETETTPGPMTVPVMRDNNN